MSEKPALPENPDSMPADDAAPSSAEAPATRSVLLYGLSLPERALRAGLGVVGGVVGEAASLLMPLAFQDSKTYSILVRQMLQFVTEDIAGVKKAAEEGEEAPPAVDNFVARKAVGNFVEMAGLATMHLSPMLILAVVSDVAYGSTKYLGELADELKRAGVIDDNSTINHAGDLLKAVSDASGTAASTFDTPPLSVEGLREAIEQTTGAVRNVDPTKMLPQAEIERLWGEMREIADREKVDLLQVSGAMSLFVLDKVGAVARGALSTVKVAGLLVDRHILDHYRQAATEIGERGLYTTLSETSGPYVEAVWLNFSSSRGTITEDLLSGRFFGRAVRGVRGWLGGSKPAPE
ncbi:MAG: hypothetical protein WD875_00585 [Pirellulales bacterium]